MAKISIHIPDDVLERVRQHKDRLNISKICSNALLKEVEVVSNVPPMVEQTRKLIEKLQKDMHRQQVESFNLGISLAQNFMEKVSYDQLRYWGSIVFSDRKRLVLPEEIEDYLEKSSLENKFKSPFNRPSFNKGWLTVMRRTWETVKDKI
jgi:hypothetical protein